MNREIISKELTLKALRSSGPGGQHVNKVSTKVELQFNIELSEGLTGEEKILLIDKLASRINKAGILIMQTDESRSQFRNKQLIIDRFFEILEKALIPKKKRKPTKTPKKAIEKRLEEKKRKSEKKQRRQDPDF